MISRTDAIDELFGIFNMLFADVSYRLKEIQEFDSGMARRSYVTSVFSLIEGVTYRMKQLALVWEDSVTSGAEKAILREEKYNIDSSGRVEVKKMEISTLPNIRFAFEILNKCFETNYKITVSGKGWMALNKSIKVRHRLMHPKNIKDIEIDSVELESTKRAAQWFVMNFAMSIKEMMVANMKLLKGPKARKITPKLNITKIKSSIGKLDKACKPYLV